MLRRSNLLRVGLGQQVIHTEQARVPGDAAFIGHAAGEQAAHRVEAASAWAM